MENGLYQIAVPVADLLREPSGARDKQVVMGAEFNVTEVKDGWVYGACRDDGYVGYVPQYVLGPIMAPTHWITDQGAFLYSEPDMKSPEVARLVFGSRISALSTTNGFVEIEGGFLPEQHISPLTEWETDPTVICLKHLSVPYLWGGNTSLGIDCSGLVQTALMSCGITCPRDSGPQFDHFTDEVTREELTRGDLVFWKGHVGMMLNNDTLIHANAYHMRVASERLDGALARIAQKEFGEVLGYRRPSRST